MRQLQNGKRIKERFRENRNEIVEVFEETEGVELAYVFGSMVEGEVGRLSDIDFGIYLREEENFIEKKLELRRKLSVLVGEDMDIVVMNTSNRLLNYNIISGGELLYEKLQQKKVEVETDIMRKYLDRRYHDKRHTEKRLERFVEKGLK
ncbi:MAG: nucleotidyltransferase domain-containing protein [Candidatus Nanohaloarchaea archaeon]